MSAQGKRNPVDLGDANATTSDKSSSYDLQVLILKELQCINTRIDQVEQRVDTRRQPSSATKNSHKLSKAVVNGSSKSSKKCSKSNAQFSH